MADSDYFSFDKALEELNMKEADLKRLVSEGGIRAFRDEDKMKFRRSDVEKLKANRGGSDASAETLADDLIFDEDEDLDLSDDEPGMATEKISSADTLDSLGGGSSMMDDDEEEVLESESGVRRSTGRGTRIREAQTGDQQSHPLVMAGLIVTAVFLFYGCFVVLDAAQATETSMTQGFAEFVEGMFGKGN